MLTFVVAAALAGVPKASSELKDSSGVRHGADQAFDGLLQTAWAEADSGAGEGSWIELKLDHPTPITSVSLWPGNLAGGSRSVREYGRPKLVTVTLTTAGGPVTQQVRLLDPSTEGPKRVDVPFDVAPPTEDGAEPAHQDPPVATALRITFDDVYPGYVFDDTCLAEVALNFTGGEVPDAVDHAKKWEGTASAQAAWDKNKKQIVEWFDAIKATDLGDSDLLGKIEDQAADGAPFMRDRARVVPAGFRVAALPPDDVAIDALLKLKDPNGIPALTLASLRVTGKDARDLAGKVEYFDAYQELLGGGNRNVPNWGESGWEPGALRSYGEPFGVTVDRLGQLYVADVANHRVQRFNTEGKADRQWAGEPGITNVWIGGTRKYYVAGSMPGTKDGEFTTPIDLALVPGKKADGFVVLDASGRVQRFDETGALAKGWKVETKSTLEPGVGGQGFIEVVGSKVVVIWSDEGHEYSLDGEELATWQIPDGIPNDTCALKGGKIGLVFAKDLVMFNPDGFRQGTILGSSEGDPRGSGFESWDCHLDEDGKMWVVTDTGLAIKYKKPGMVDYMVTISDHPLVYPRFAVQDDVIWLVEHDEIHRIDALELETKADLAAQKAAEGAATP